MKRSNECEQIAHAAEELGQTGLTLESLVEYERTDGRNATFTQVAVASAFFKERGIVEVLYWRNHGVVGRPRSDAISEHHASAYIS